MRRLGFEVLLVLSVAVATYTVATLPGVHATFLDQATGGMTITVKSLGSELALPAPTAKPAATAAPVETAAPEATSAPTPKPTPEATPEPTPSASPEPSIDPSASPIP
jgi:hypothetical protein